MIMDLLAHPDHLRILRAVERRPMRFVFLELELRLNPARIDRALKSLLKGKWIASGPADTATGRFIMVYQLTRKGAAFLSALRDFAAALKRREADLGTDAVEQLRAFL